MKADLKLRRARDSDLTDMAYLHFNAFPRSGETPEERRRKFTDNPLVPLENYWVASSGGELVGMFAQYNFRMFRGGKTLPVVGIASVAVAPHHRRKGVARFLMERALEMMEHNGVSLSILHPFRHPFYAQLGWGILTRTIYYRMDPHRIGEFSPEGSVEMVKNEEQKEEVMALYDHIAHQRGGLLARDFLHWEELVFPRGFTFAYRSPEGLVEGYLVLSYLPSIGEGEVSGREIKVWEWFWLNGRALQGLLSFLSRMKDQVKTIHLPEQTGLPLEFLLHDPLQEGDYQTYLTGARMGAKAVGLMGRVVNVKRALIAGAPYGEGDLTLTIQLTDPCLSWNREPIHLSFHNGEVELTRTQGECVIRTSIAIFSSLWWGALTFSQAWELGLVDIIPWKHIPLLDRLFTQPPPICWDYF